MVQASAGVSEAMADWEMALLLRQTFQSVWQTSAALQKFRLELITPVPASRTIRSGVGDMGIITDLATVTSMIETSPSKLDNESFSFVSCRWKAVVSSNDVICWGRNDYGQFGITDTFDRLTPVHVGEKLFRFVLIHEGESFFPRYFLIGGRVWYDDHLFRDAAMSP